MRIVYFSDNFYPEISGISDSILTTGKELSKRGHTIAYVGPWYPKHVYARNSQPISEDVRIKRIPALPFFGSPTGQSRTALPSGSSLSFIKKFKPDIIHTQSILGTGLEALLCAKLLKIPLVGTNHTPIEEFVRYLPGIGRVLKSLARRYDAWYYNRTRFTTAPYAGLIQNMRTVGFTKDAAVQPNPIPSFSHLATQGDRTTAKKELGVEGFVILCSGRLAPEKNVDVVLHAFALLLKKIPEATLVITGRGSAEASLKRVTETLGIQDCIRFTGFVVAKELAQLYAAADLYVIMSTAETQSLSLMQAFAVGIPAISARSHGLIDYTPASCGFLVDPGDAQALATRMEQLLNDPQLREEMGQQAMRFVEQFSPARIADAWEKIYQQVLQKR